MIIATTFASRDDAEAVMARMRTAFDTARDILADEDDPSPYQKLLALAGALTNHLAITALKLPRIVTFRLTAPFPALTASQMIYYDPNRWEELVDSNKIIHPAFCPRELTGLSK